MKKLALDTNNISSSPYIVHTMCDRIEPFASDINKKIFEPGCGTGNFLLEILQRRVSRANGNSEKIFQAITNIYAVDIDKSKIQIAKTRLLDYVEASISEFHNLSYAFLPSVENILNHNIIQADFIHDLTKQLFYDWKIGTNYSTTPAGKFSLSEIMEFSALKSEATC